MVLSSIQTKSGNKPYAIVVAKNGNLVYTDYNDSTVNIVKCTNIQEEIRLQGWKPRSISSTLSGDLLVLMKAKTAKKQKLFDTRALEKKEAFNTMTKGNPSIPLVGYLMISNT